MKKGILQTLKFLAFFAVGVFLLWLAFRNINLKSLADGLRKANYYWILLAMFFSMLAFFSRARRWVLLVNPLGYRPSFWNTYHAMMTGYLANIALPRVGEITKCVALGKKEKIPVDQLIGTVVVERTIDFFSLLLIMVIMIIVSGDAISHFLKESVYLPLQQKISFMFGFTWIIWFALIAITGILLFLLYRFRKSLLKIRFFAKMFNLAKGVLNGLKTITNLKRKWEFLFHTIFIWINYTLMTWVVVFSLESTSSLNLADGIFLLVIGGLAMSAPVQSGLGAFHYIISRGLYFIDGIKLEDGLVYAILTHESELIFITILGTISFFVIFGKHRKEKIS